MKITIAVPAFNEEKLLARSLAAIRQACHVFSTRGWLSEIVVCDNNSTDKTAQIARASGAAVVFEPINQISRARNKAGFAAQGDW
ncbi:MAG TPA: glycosyltransferase, partial [Verrucomicrobiae bacterium]|nr:glycosyltransferase [Verrucomicrobiae bacterium]